MKITSYIDAVKYLESFIGRVIFKVNKEFVKEHDPLERMRVLLSLLGNPQEKFKSVLVGGTSGKGSTAYLISHILTTSGYKTGFTLSPHLQKVNERLQINGQPISDDNFVKLLKTLILPSIREMSRMEIGAPSYFEILVGMAFTYFVQKKVDIAVVEVGMGGEFDATNTLNPLIAVLTNVGLDHTNVLGKSVSQIARTKAGIIKRLKMRNEKLEITGKNISHFSSLTSHLTVVSGVKQSSVIKIVEEKCEKAGAKLLRLGRDFNYKIKKESLGGSVFDLTTSSGRGLQLNGLNLSLLGDYQVENASLAIEAALNLNRFGFEVKENVIRKALKTAFFPGRFEVLRCHPEFISGSPANRQASLRSNEMLKQDGYQTVTRQVQHDNKITLVLDGAHNPTKMKEFLKSLKKIFPKEKKIFIIGFKFDKDIPKMLKQITKVADQIITTEFNRATDMAISASADAFNIKDQILKIKNDTKVTVEKDSRKALKMGIKTIQQFSNTTIIIVTGSLYLVGEIRDQIKG